MPSCVSELRPELHRGASAEKVLALRGMWARCGCEKGLENLRTRRNSENERGAKQDRAKVRLRQRPLRG